MCVVTVLIIMVLGQSSIRTTRDQVYHKSLPSKRQLTNRKKFVREIYMQKANQFSFSGRYLFSKMRCQINHDKIRLTISSNIGCVEE